MTDKEFKILLKKEKLRHAQLLAVNAIVGGVFWACVGAMVMWLYLLKTGRII